MKIKSIVLASLIACAGFATQAAQAATINYDAPVALVADADGGYNSHFGNNFSSALTGESFSDKFMFTVTQSFDSSTSLTSSYLASTSIKDLDITSFNLYQYNASGAVTASYIGLNTTANGENPTNSWELTTYGLSAGTYYIQVTGTVTGSGGGSYGSDLTISPTIAAVPEPETYGMMLAGLGLVGFMARRKRAV